MHLLENDKDEKIILSISIENMSVLLQSFNETIQILIDELSSTNDKINETKNSLEENNSILEELQSGSEYELHDPLYEEVVAFIDSDNSSSITDEINSAKKQGIRCSYVQIIVTDGMYELIAFDTVDKGIIYFEPVTDYEVNPEVGKNYTECVVGQPYILENDTITDILIIW